MSLCCLCVLLLNVILLFRESLLLVIDCYVHFHSLTVVLLLVVCSATLDVL